MLTVLRCCKKHLCRKRNLGSVFVAVALGLSLVPLRCRVDAAMGKKGDASNKAGFAQVFIGF